MAVGQILAVTSWADKLNIRIKNVALYVLTFSVMTSYWLHYHNDDTGFPTRQKYETYIDLGKNLKYTDNLKEGVHYNHLAVM